MAELVQKIKALREQTGCSMADCKQALLASGHDVAGAQALLVSTGKYRPDTDKSWSWDALQQGVLENGQPQAATGPCGADMAGKAQDAKISALLQRMAKADGGSLGEVVEQAVSTLVSLMGDAMPGAMEQYDAQRDTSSEITIVADTKTSALVFAYGDGGGLEDSRGGDVFACVPIGLLAPCHTALGRLRENEEEQLLDGEVIGWVEAAVFDNTLAFDEQELCVYGGCDYRVQVWPPLRQGTE